MTKSELIRHLCVRWSTVPAKDIKAIVELIFDEIGGALAHNKRVEIRGFGAFSLRKRDARKARNPRTNEMVELKTRNALYFRAGKELREMVNQ